MQIKKLIQTVSLFSAVAAGAFVASSAGSARAAAVSAVDCQMESDYIGDYYVTELGIGNQSAGVGARARTVHCDGSGPRAATGAVYIDGIDDSARAVRGQEERVMEKSSRLRALGYVLPICAGLAAGVVLFDSCQRQ